MLNVISGMPKSNKQSIHSGFSYDIDIIKENNHSRSEAPSIPLVGAIHELPLPKLERHKSVPAKAGKNTKFESNKILVFFESLCLMFSVFVKFAIHHYIYNHTLI